MDVWWRRLSEKHSDYKRLAPDYFTYEKTNPFQVVPEMTDTMMFSRVQDRTAYAFDTFAHQDRTDHISGKT